MGELMSDPDFVEEITRRRPTGAFGARGEFESSYTDEPILVVWEPVQAKPLDLNPEGSRGGSAMINVWSASEMRATDGKTFEADVLVLDTGDTYRVVGTEDWAKHGYYFALAEKFIAP